jgi:RHS repeat-associated protein
MPFGEEVPVEAMNSTNKRHFTGHERDSESSLDYMMARYYCPSLGRFLSEDPLGDGFTYVGNSPTNFTDPTGLKFGGFICQTVCVCTRQQSEDEPECHCHCVYDSDIEEDDEEDPDHPCGYTDFSIAVSVPAAAVLIAATPVGRVLGALSSGLAGVQKDDATGNRYGYLGVSLGPDFGWNRIPFVRTNLSLTHSYRGSTGTGFFLAASGTLATKTKQVGVGYAGSWGTFGEAGDATSLAGVGVQAAFLFPLGRSRPVPCRR